MSVSPAVVQWMAESAPTFEFAASLQSQYNRKGVLSPAQIAAAERCIEKRKASMQAREASAPDADMSPLVDCFKHAKDQGAKRPGLIVGSFKFTMAGDESANPGAIYAKDRTQGVYLGKFTRAKFLKARECTADQQALLMEIAKDPLRAAIDHGRMTGECALCSRTLSDPESIERGIGPVCAKKFGW